MVCERLGVGSHRMYSFYTYRILDCPSLYPLSFTNVCSFISPLFSLFTSRDSSFFPNILQTQISARTNTHRYSMHAIPIRFGIVSKLDWYLFCVLFPCFAITCTIHTYERSAISNKFVDMCLSKTYLTQKMSSQLNAHSEEL